MALDIIEDIKQAEAKAEELVREAADEARNTVREARQAAEALIAKTDQEARQQAKFMLDQAQQQARDEIEPEIQANAQHCNELKSMALSRMDAAVNLILDRIGGT